MFLMQEQAWNKIGKKIQKVYIKQSEKGSQRDIWCSSQSSFGKAFWALVI
jgi:hypothetical protein